MILLAITGLDRWPSDDVIDDTSDAPVRRVFSINSDIQVISPIVYESSVTCAVINRTRLMSACYIL